MPQKSETIVTNCNYALKNRKDTGLNEKATKRIKIPNIK
jgi:hypothetical protein